MAQMTDTEGEGQKIRGASIPVGRKRVLYSPLYSRLVSILKIVLPTIAISMTALIVLWPQIQQNEGGFSLGLTEDELAGKQNLFVTNARYKGKEKGGQPFAVTAENINQQGAESSIVNLDKPKADILLSDESWAAVTSENGTFDKARQVLELVGNVNFFHDLGYEFRTHSATLDLIGGNMFGFDPVEGQGPFGYVNAEGFRIFDRGSRVELTGKTKVIINKSVE